MGKKLSCCSKTESSTYVIDKGRGKKGGIARNKNAEPTSNMGEEEQSPKE